MIKHIFFLLVLFLISCNTGSNYKYKYKKDFTLYLKKTFNQKLDELGVDSIIFVPIDGCSCVTKKNISILSSIVKNNSSNTILIIGGQSDNNDINEIIDKIYNTKTKILQDTNSQYKRFRINMFEPNILIINDINNVYQKFY